MERAAGEARIPLVLGLGCALAESGLDPRAERWGQRNAEAKLALQGLGLLVETEGSPMTPDEARALLEDVVDTEWPDLSWGYSQRIAAYHWAGDRSATVDNCLAVRSAVLADPERDLVEMSWKLRGCLEVVLEEDLRWVGGDPLLGALVVYNAGHLPGLEEDWWRRYASHVASYRISLDRAREMLEG